MKLMRGFTMKKLLFIFLAIVSFGDAPLSIADGVPNSQGLNPDLVIRFSCNLDYQTNEINDTLNRSIKDQGFVTIDIGSAQRQKKLVLSTVDVMGLNSKGQIITIYSPLAIANGRIFILSLFSKPPTTHDLQLEHDLKLFVAMGDICRIGSIATHENGINGDVLKLYEWEVNRFKKLRKEISLSKN